MKSTFLALSASMLLGSAAALPADTSSTVKATSSAVSATSSTPSATPGPKKRGLSYNDPTLTTLFNGPNSQISWGYDWGQVPGTGFDSAYEFVPMLWNNAAGATDNWFAHVEAAIAKGTDHLLAFNEPDYSGQANMTPEEAAAAYLLWMEPFAGRVKLGAPAVTNGGAPMGLTWLAEFMGNCTLCTIDFVPFHWYDSAQNYWYFKAYIEQVYAQVQRPIWITEVCQRSAPFSRGEGGGLSFANDIYSSSTVMATMPPLSVSWRWSCRG